MKNYNLYLTVRIAVSSKLSSLSKTVTELETETKYSFSSTENIEVLETEILLTEFFNPLN